MPPTYHHVYSPSSSSRWIKCPGSVKGNLPEKEETEHMRRGTMAHDVAEGVLRGGSLSCSDEEICSAVEQYVEYIEGLPDGEQLIECSVASCLVEDFGGTMDHLIVTPKELYVTDFKFGLTPVSAVDNHQLKCYLNLAREVYPDRERFFGSIVQPRVGPPQMEEYTAAELDEFMVDVMAATGSDETCAGPHCKWCPLLGNCATEREYREELVSLTFDDNTEINQYVAVLDHVEVLSELARTAKHKLIALALEGESIPGYKLARSIGNRAWSQADDKIKKALRKLGLKAADMHAPKKLKSPAQIEKLVSKEEVAKLVHRPDRGVTIVPASSKAPEYIPSEMFDEENE